MAKSRNSRAKQQTSERMRMIMLFITCCGRKPTAEELDGDITTEKKQKLAYESKDGNNNITCEVQNGSGDTCAPNLKRIPPTRPSPPSRPPPPKRLLPQAKCGSVVLLKETDELAQKEIQQNNNKEANMVSNGDTTLPESVASKRLLPNRRVPPKRPPPPMKATPPKKATPPMRPPAPSANLIAELLERNRQVVKMALRVGPEQSDTKPECDSSVFSSQVNVDVADQITSKAVLEEYPQDMNPFADDDDDGCDGDDCDFNYNAVVVDECGDDDDDDDDKERSNGTDEYPDELNPFADDDD